MPLLVPSKTPFGEFTYREGSHLTTRPTSVQHGTSLTPGNNTFGTALQVGADVAVELWGIKFWISGLGASTLAKDGLVQVGFDFAGGTTFPASPDRYNSIMLLTGAASAYGTNGSPPAQFYFPLRIPAGTAILARASTNNATVGTVGVAWQGVGRPKYPESIRRGSYVESLGVTTATSSGTAITPGTTSEGTAVSLGTLNADAPCWWWEIGWGVNDATTNALCYHADLLRDSSTGPVIVENLLINHTGGEMISKPSTADLMPISDVPGGTQIYGRAQCSTTSDAAISMMAYGVGG